MALLTSSSTIYPRPIPYTTWIELLELFGRVSQISLASCKAPVKEWTPIPLIARLYSPARLGFISIFVLYSDISVSLAQSDGLCFSIKLKLLFKISDIHPPKLVMPILYKVLAQKIESHADILTTRTKKINLKVNNKEQQNL